MTKPFWVHVTDPRTDEVLLSRQMTPEEWKDDKGALAYAQEALDFAIPLDSEEADHPNCADIKVTFYRNKKDIGGAVCWSSHGFYAKEG